MEAPYQEHIREEFGGRIGEGGWRSEPSEDPYSIVAYVIRDLSERGRIHMAERSS